MFDREKLKAFMEEKFSLKIAVDKIGEESVLLYLEELDENLITNDVLKLLPNPVVFHTYIYDEDSEWIIGIALEKETNSPLFIICLRNGEKVYSEILNERH